MNWISDHLPAFVAVAKQQLLDTVLALRVALVVIFVNLIGQLAQDGSHHHMRLILPTPTHTVLVRM